jgi:hypothetical protein
LSGESGSGASARGAAARPLEAGFFFAVGALALTGLSSWARDLARHDGARANPAAGS